MSFIGSGFWQLPGIDTALQTTENIVWWGKREQQRLMGAVIDAAAVDSGDTPTTVLRQGLIMGKYTSGGSSGKIAPWDTTQTDGRQHIFGILLVDQSMLTNGVTKDRYFGFCHVGGNLKPSSLIIQGNSTLGIVGDAKEFLVRALLTSTGRWLLDDNLNGSTFDYRYLRTMSGAAQAYSVLAADNNTLFYSVCTGGPPGITYTLPAPLAGLRYWFAIGSDAGIQVASASANQIVAYNNATASSVTIDTTAKSIGGMLEFIGISSSLWFCKVHLANLAQIVTVA